jgi:hypothetical protein
MCITSNNFNLSPQRPLVCGVIQRIYAGIPCGEITTERFATDTNYSPQIFIRPIMKHKWSDYFSVVKDQWFL